MFKERHTSKAMVMHIAVGLSDCPPSDKGVGCKHGAHSQLVADMGNIFLETRSARLLTVECTGGRR